MSVHVYACMRVCDHGQVLYGSNYWQRRPSDTHSASLSGPNGIYLPPPLPLFCLSLDFYLFLALSFFYPVSFSLPPSFLPPSLYPPLCLYLSLSFSFTLCGLNYFRMSPNKGARWNPFLFFYREQKPQTYFNSHHIFPICAKKPWK